MKPILLTIIVALGPLGLTALMRREFNGQEFTYTAAFTAWLAACCWNVRLIYKQSEKPKV
jgi:hypothetical protein